MRENVQKSGTFIDFLYFTTTYRFLQKLGHMVKYSVFFFSCFKMRDVPPKEGQLASMRICNKALEKVVNIIVVLHMKFKSAG